jgi:formylglycine-generating enzyme required for sulfatase activity
MRNIKAVSVVLVVLVFITTLYLVKRKRRNDNQEIGWPNIVVPIGDSLLREIELRFVSIKASGKPFQSGSPDGEPGRDPRMETQSERTVEDFEISETEITMFQYWRVTDPVRVLNGLEKNLPVSNVSYDEAKIFCHKLSKLTGQECRLPTDAEWEFACRGGTTEIISVWPVGGTTAADAITRFGFGDPAVLERAIKHACNVSKRLCHVKTYKPNNFGLYDMHGNVAEWVDETDLLTEADFPTQRVVRGGSAFGSPLSCRSASRALLFKDEKAGSVGFRVARKPSGG